MKIKAIILSLLFVPFLAFAQNEQTLPSAGLTPENPFYFVDKLGEALQEFFTFSQEGKAHLQIAFAAERIAEIKIVLETKGVEAEGLAVAEARLQKHLGDAAEIVVKEKGKGKDVSKLAKELDDNYNETKSALKASFDEQEEMLETQEDELKRALREAYQAGDTTQAEIIAEELGQVKAQLELLELKEEELEDELEAEEEKLEEEMEDSDEAEGEIEEALEEKQEIIDEATKDGVTLPVSAFFQFNNLISQAQNAFDAGDYKEAENLAEQADEVLEDIEETVEKLEEELENGDEENEDNKDDEDNETEDEDEDEQEDEDGDDE
ncbi:MAG: hypothetical protein ACJKSS_01925 [Patescibacteria group bacterium UBA2103]